MENSTSPVYPQTESQTTSLKQHAWLSYLIYGVLVMLAVFFIGRYLAGQWEQIEAQTAQINWGGLILAELGFIIGLGLLPLGSYVILRNLGRPLSLPETWQAFFVSQIAKYLPGSVWSIPGRVYIYHRRGLPAVQGATALAWEMMLMIMGAAMVGFLGIGLLLGEFSWLIVAGGFSILVAGFLVLGLVMRSPDFIEKIPLPGKIRKMLSLLKARLSWRAIGLVGGLYAANWLVLGLAFSQVARSVSENFEAGWVLPLVGLHAVAWLVGFLVVFTPGGIGVRDGLLIIGLGTLVEAPLPLMVAVLTRILWTIAEVLGAISAVLVYSYYQNKSEQ
jgi:hypothetical protein